MNLIDTGEVPLSSFTGEIYTCNTKDKYVSKQCTLMFLIRLQYGQIIFSGKPLNLPVYLISKGEVCVDETSLIF